MTRRRVFIIASINVLSLAIAHIDDTAPTHLLRPRHRVLAKRAASSQPGHVTLPQVSRWISPIERMARSTAGRCRACWITMADLLGSLQAITNPRVFANPRSTMEAWGRVTSWLECETDWISQPMNRHAELFGRLLFLPGVRANLVRDAILRNSRSSTACSCGRSTAISRDFPS
jgi:hypothetical protein